MNHFKQVFTKDKDQKGVATLMIVTILTLVLVAISIAMARTSLVKFRTLEAKRNARETYFLSESGLEDTVLQLEDNINYQGNPTGEVTEVGTYYSTVDGIGDDYTIQAWGSEKNTEKKVGLSITLQYELAEVTTKATYMADFFVIYGEGARIRGDIWTNDDFEVVYKSQIEGNLHANGKGSMAVNWVWDGSGSPGGTISDNPDTADEVEGNITAFDAVKVSGPGAIVTGNVTSNEYVWELLGGDIQGTITEYADLTWDPIPVPSFNFEDYEELAVTNGTYFNNANEFENYVESLDDGNERRIPDGVYYINNGAVKIPAGTPVYLDGMLVVEDNLYIYAEWYQNAQNGLPAIVCGKDLEIGNKFNFFSLNYDWSGPVRINGIIFTEKDVTLFRTFSEEDIIIEGAVWAGDDIFVLKHTYIHYNIDPLNVTGFGFVSGVSDLVINYWEEIID
jgi:cytoskeletal protein CcmA (bactofilin family)